MINVNELMVGNWLMGCNKQPFQMTPYDFETHALKAEREESDGCPAGIPLTPEILEKAGFVSNRWGGWMLHLYDRDYLMCGVNMDVYIDKPTIDQDGTWYDFDVHVVECKYVHQLQNLYFALTNQPLKIEL